jgi:glyoxylase-like metal-dependent hydrolase (beta-lactamase superfamily II)
MQIDLSPPPFHVGGIEIRRIMEMEFPFLEATTFLPDATEAALAPLRPRFEPWALEPGTGKLILALQSYLVRTSRHTILIDTCVGCDKSSPFPFWNMRDDAGWLSRLAAAGAPPEAIDYVFCTHLHGDHIGWNTRLLDGRFVPTFPNARYVFARREIAHAETMPPERAISIRQSVQPVLEAGQAVIVDSDFALDDEVWLAPTPGHTPGHVAVHLRSNGAEAVMCGDLMHSPIQCARPHWSARPDADKALAAETRRRFLETSLAENRLVMTAHFPSPSTGRVAAEDSAFGFRFGV